MAVVIADNEVSGGSCEVRDGRARPESELVLADQRQHGELEADHRPDERVHSDEQRELAAFCRSPSCTGVVTRRCRPPGSPIRKRFGDANVPHAMTGAAGAIVMVVDRLDGDEREHVREQINKEAAPFGGGEGLELPAACLVLLRPRGRCYTVVGVLALR